MKTIDVNFDEFVYPIKIGYDITKDVVSVVGNKTKDKKILVVMDENLKQFSWDGIIGNPFQDKGYDIHMMYMNGGKSSKTLDIVIKLYTILEKNRFARDSTIVAVGGGIVGDLAGFVASTWFRGMNLIHIPTTLTAMIDSSVGGKVAINFKDTINAIGNYHHPIANIIDLKFIKTLPEREYFAGMGEIIKCAMINDKDFFDYLFTNVNRIKTRSSEEVLYLIQKTIDIKVNHVRGDIRESGKRLLLNYGHTLGHAIEMSTMDGDEERYRHGESVAIGMVAVAHIAEKHLNTHRSVRERLTQLLCLYGLSTHVKSPETGLIDKCLELVQLDKKRKGNQIRLILADTIGSASVFDDVPFDLIRDAFNKVIDE